MNNLKNKNVKNIWKKKQNLFKNFPPPRFLLEKIQP